MYKKYINTENLSISEELYNFINNQALPGTNVIEKNFLEGTKSSNP